MQAPELGQGVDGQAVRVVQSQCRSFVGRQALDDLTKRQSERAGPLRVEHGPLLLGPQRAAVRDEVRGRLVPRDDAGLGVSAAQHPVSGAHGRDLQPPREATAPLVPIDRGPAALSDEHDFERLGERFVAKRGRQAHARQRGSDRSAVIANQTLGSTLDARAACSCQVQVGRVRRRWLAAMKAFGERLERKLEVEYSLRFLEALLSLCRFLDVQPCPPIEDLLVATERETLGRTLDLHIRDCAQCRDALEILRADDEAPDERSTPLAMRYQLLGVKAQGGQGVICDARDLLLDREVAVKLLSIEDPSSTVLLDEARRLARFAHPRVVRVHDAGVDAGQVFVVMELIDGVSADVLALAATFSVRDAIRIVRQASEGLDALHREGLVHGDVSPRNIVVNRDGEAVLVDLGLSGSIEASGGTPGFVAPEVWRTRKASPASDQYALGRVLEFLLERTSPHAQGAALVARRACDPDPANRFASLAALRWRLGAAPARRWFGAASLGFLCLGVSWTTEPAGSVMTYIEASALERSAAGADAEVAGLVATASDLAGRADERALMLRAHLLAAKFAPSDAHGRESVARALMLAESLGDDEAHAEALALASLYATSTEDRLFLADYAARVDTGGVFPSVVLAFAGGEPQPADAEPDLVRSLAVIRALNTIGHPDLEAAPLDCAFVDDPLARALCVAVDAAALSDKAPPLAIERADLALELLANEHAPGERCLPLQARGVALIEGDPSAALEDLQRAARCYEDDGEDEPAPNAAARAYALVKLNRASEAEAIVERLEDRAASLAPTPRRFLEHTRSALRPETRNEKN